MTSVASLNSIALLVLQQTNAASHAGMDSNRTSPADDLVLTLNGVTKGTSPAKSQAFGTISNALLEMREKQDSTVQEALELIDSDDFQSPDPSLKETLKKIISENGEKFAQTFKAQQTKHPGITHENALFNALTETVSDNRDKFSKDEIIIATRFSGSQGFTFIPDINGNSSSNDLLEKYRDQPGSFAPGGEAYQARMDRANSLFESFGWEKWSF